MISNVDNSVNEIENSVDVTSKPEKRLIRQLSVSIKNLSESYSKMKTNKVLPSLDKNYIKQSKQRNNVNSMLLVKNENVTPLIQCINYNVFSIRTPWKYISKENTLRNNIHELLTFFKILQKLLNKYFLQYNLNTQLTERSSDDTSQHDSKKLYTFKYTEGLSKYTEGFGKEVVLGKGIVYADKDDYGLDSEDEDLELDSRLSYLISFCNNIYNKINILFEPIVDNKENKSAILRLKETEDDRNLIYINNKYYCIKHFGCDLPSLNYQKFVILDLCSYNHIGVYDNFEYMNEFMGQIISLPMNDKYIPTLTYILKVVSVALFWINFDSRDNLIILNYNNINFNIMLIYACIMIATGTETSELESKLLNTLTWRKKVSTGGAPNNENIPMMYPLLKWPTCYKRYLSYYKQLNTSVKNILKPNAFGEKGKELGKHSDSGKRPKDSGKHTKESSKNSREYDKYSKESDKTKSSDVKDSMCTPRNSLDMNYILNSTTSLYTKKSCLLNNIIMINTLIPQYNIDIEIYQINDYNNSMYNYSDVNPNSSAGNMGSGANSVLDTNRAKEEDAWSNSLKLDSNTSCKYYNSIFFKNYKCNSSEEDNAQGTDPDTARVIDNIKLISCPYNYNVTTTNASAPGTSSLLSSLNVTHQSNKASGTKSLESDVVIYNYNNSGVVLEDDVIVVFVVNKNKLNRKSIGSYSFNTNMLTNMTMQLTKYDLDIWEQNNNILLLNNVKIIINTTDLETANLKIPKSLTTTSSKQSKSDTKSPLLKSDVTKLTVSSDVTKSPLLNSDGLKSDVLLDEVDSGEMTDGCKVPSYEVDAYSIVYGSVMNFINNHIKKVDMKECENLMKLTGHHKETCVLALKICNNFSNAMNLLIKLNKPYHNNYYYNNIANDYYNNINIQDDHPFINHMSKLQISQPKIKSSGPVQAGDKPTDTGNMVGSVADTSLFENITNENLLKLLNFNSKVITHNITNLQLHQFITSDTNCTHSTSVSDVMVTGSQLNNTYPPQVASKAPSVHAVRTMASEDQSNISGADTTKLVDGTGTKLVDPSATKLLDPGTAKLVDGTPIRIDSTFNNLELIKSVPVKSVPSGKPSTIASISTGDTPVHSVPPTQPTVDQDKEVLLTTRLDSNIASPVNVAVPKTPSSSVSSSSSTTDADVKDITLTTTIAVPDKLTPESKLDTDNLLKDKVSDDSKLTDKEADKNKLMDKEDEKSKLMDKQVPKVPEKLEEKTAKVPPPVAKSAGKAPPPLIKKGGKMPPPIPKGSIKSVKRVLPLGVKLHWKPLNKFNDTIFSSIHESDIYNEELIDTTTIKKLFSRTSTSNTNLSILGTADLNDKNKNADTSKKSKLIEILDNKRVQNLSIILRFNSYEDYLTLLKNVNNLVYINIHTKSLKNTLDTGNSGDTNPSNENLNSVDISGDIFGNLNDTVVMDNITKLYIVYPNSNEIESLMNSYKANSNLEAYRLVERMLLEILLRENMHCKIKLCKYLIDLKHQLNLINEQFNIYKLAIEEIKTSRVLPLILNIILQYGNFVNYGSIKAEKGFTLSSTIKLMDFKTQDNLLSSLHYLIINLYIKLYKNTTDTIDTNNTNNSVDTMNNSVDNTNNSMNNSVSDDLVDISNDLLCINMKLTNVLRAEKISSGDINTILKDLSNELVNIISLLNSTNTVTTTKTNENSKSSDNTKSGDNNSCVDKLDTVEIMNNVVHVCKNKLNEINVAKNEIYSQIKNVWIYLGEDVSSITKTAGGGVGEELSNLENIFKILSELIKCIIKVFNDIRAKPTKYLIVLSNEEDKQLFLKLFMDNKSLNNYNKIKNKRPKLLTPK